MATTSCVPLAPSPSAASKRSASVEGSSDVTRASGCILMSSLTYFRRVSSSRFDGTIESMIDVPAARLYGPNGSKVLLDGTFVAVAKHPAALGEGCRRSGRPEDVATVVGVVVPATRGGRPA